MRTPGNETVADARRPDHPRPSASPPAAGGAKGEGDRAAPPLRTCILARHTASQARLVRLALAPDGRVLPDVRAKAPGRGAWLGATRGELEEAIARNRLRGALARAFKGAAFAVPDDLPGLVAAALERNALDRLGLEARAGAVVTGSERIEAAARAGRLAALYHAVDAGDDGRRRLAQAWRVGSGREGSDVRGVALPVARAILSLALGRENVVHLGVTDRSAAVRVSDALDRWLRFIGSESLSAPCATAPQGASAPRRGEALSAVDDVRGN